MTAFAKITDNPKHYFRILWRRIIPMLQKVVREGLTFDDVLLVPARSEVLPFS